MSMVLGIHHVCMKCSCKEDYDKVVSFYSGVLELSVKRTFRSN